MGDYGRRNIYRYGNTHRNFSIERQDSNSQATTFPLVVGAAFFTSYFINLFATAKKVIKPKLENHPMCGITTGGQEECYWDCRLTYLESPIFGAGSSQLILNPECLRDCFPPMGDPNTCGTATTLLENIIMDNEVAGAAGITEFCSDPFTATCNTQCAANTCSTNEYTDLFTDKCIEFFRTQPDLILNTIIFKLLPCSCCPTSPIDGKFNFFQFVCLFDPNETANTCEAIHGTWCNAGGCPAIHPLPCPPSRSGRAVKREKEGQRSKNDQSNFDHHQGNKYRQNSQLRSHQQRKYERRPTGPKGEKSRAKTSPPITRIGVNSIIYRENDYRTDIDYTHTRHRYPWICSLKVSNVDGQHICAVNLLQVPPGPTVIVGAAHCTYLCRDSDTKEILDSCCCARATENCINKSAMCGNNQGLFEMEPRDATIICGEWETDSNLYDVSDEEYNVILKLKEIVRHPSFNTTEGSQGGNDLAIFKVDDSEIQNNVRLLKLFPACLPSKQNKKYTEGFNSGWSKPPPLRYLDRYATTRDYSDYYKQWHIKMDIVPCEDPERSAVSGTQVQYPTNTSYPPGSICAKDFTRHSCFANGDSGGPLMIKDNARFHIEGLLSFNKGCEVLNISSFRDGETWAIEYRTENPTAFMRLSCFMPWIADQYDMEYDAEEEADECKTGTGNKTTENDIDNCRTNTFTGEFLGAPCIFPFYYEGALYHECILLVVEGFTLQKFGCPIRNINTKINGTNSFTFHDAFGSLCSVDGTLNTEVSNNLTKPCAFAERFAFQTCKNNCPGEFQAHTTTSTDTVQSGTQPSSRFWSSWCRVLSGYSFCIFFFGHISNWSDGFRRIRTFRHRRFDRVNDVNSRNLSHSTVSGWRQVLHGRLHSKWTCMSKLLLNLLYKKGTKVML